MESSPASGSISFDWAAKFYDRTRALPDDAAAAVFATLQRELGGRGRCLEIGVGTGRLALPLTERGLAITGVDLSGNMLARLRENAGATARLPLVLGDATRLPFADDAFGGVYAAWVLHLIRGWRTVVAEVVRVARPGGVVLIDLGGSDGGIQDEIKTRFRDAAAVDWPLGPEGYDELDGEMERLGARPRGLEPIVSVREMMLEEDMASLEAGVYSVSRLVDEATRKRAADETRRWAEERFGSLSEPREVRATYVWRAYDLP